MKQLLLSTLLVGSLHAAAITLVGGGAEANSYVFSNVNGDGFDVIVTAFSLLDGGSTFSDSLVGRYGTGLGVCNGDEQPTCGSPLQQLDNSDGIDFLLFQFSAPVIIQAVRIDPVNIADRDAMYFLGNAVLNLDLDPVGPAASTLADLPGLGFGAAIFDAAVPGSTQRIVFLANGGATHNSLLFGVPNGGDLDLDSFMVNAIKYDLASDVPEPRSLALFGAGLIGLGMLARLRIRKKNAK